jgi:hypothetical protein
MSSNGNQLPEMFDPSAQEDMPDDDRLDADPLQFLFAVIDALHDHVFAEWHEIGWLASEFRITADEADMREAQLERCRALLRDLQALEVCPRLHQFWRGGAP